MYAVADMDKLLSQMDEVFTEYHRLVMARAKQEMSVEEFTEKIKLLGKKRTNVLSQYQIVARRVEEIKKEFGGTIKPQ